MIRAYPAPTTSRAPFLGFGFEVCPCPDNASIPTGSPRHASVWPSGSKSFRGSLVCNLIRLVRLEASARQSVLVERVSFIDTVTYLAVATYQSTHLHLRVKLYRTTRVEPRCVKLRPEQYTQLKRPRSEFHKHLKILGLMA